MGHTAPAASPAPYNKIVQSCRARPGLAAAAFLRSVSFIDDPYASAGVLALILQLRLEHAPARIEHGFGHPRLCKFQAAHIAYKYKFIFFDYFSGKFMQRIFAAPGGLSMQAFGLAFMTPALGLGDLLLDTPIEMPGKEFLPITRGGRIL